MYLPLFLINIRLHKPGGFSRSPCQINAVNHPNIEIRQINVDFDVNFDRIARALIG